MGMLMTITALHEGTGLGPVMACWDVEKVRR
jgi:hypothetical protein